MTVSDASDLDSSVDITLVPHDRVELFENPIKQTNLSVTVENLDNGDG